MTLEINKKIRHLPDESEFTVYEWDIEPGEDEAIEYVRIHPWVRQYEHGEINRRVSVVSGIEDTGNYGHVIVDRDKFVEGLLAVFPELKRATD